MGNSNSRYEQNMLSNLPPGYIPTYPAVPPYALKKKGWNPFGKSRKKREEELKQYFYTTPFVWMYPPGSSCTYDLAHLVDRAVLPMPFVEIVPYRSRLRDEFGFLLLA